MGSAVRRAQIDDKYVRTDKMPKSFDRPFVEGRNFQERRHWSRSAEPENPLFVRKAHRSARIPLTIKSEFVYFDKARLTWRALSVG